MKNITVPFFISHQGCPHTCCFCDQRTISGSAGALPDAAAIEQKIREWQGGDDRPVEVAFFGGTFSALPRFVQQSLLQPLQPLLVDGIVSAIRISTRPDALDDQTVCWLRQYGVTTIEIGMQSLDDEVLQLAGRGHRAADSLAALASVRNHGLQVVAQLMPGLPGDTAEKSLAGVEQLLAVGTDALRIYPTLVIRGTALAEMYRQGTYQPLELTDTVQLCKQMLHLAWQAGVPVLRIGLQAEQGLNEESIVAGPWHPALGQLVQSALYADLMACLLERMDESSSCEVRCHPSRISDCVGHQREHLLRLAHRISRVQGDTMLKKEELELINMNCQLKGNILTDLHY